MSDMAPQRYPLAERFVAPQGEGLFTGTPMAFMRLVGCSVGQKVCTACDTDFSRIHGDMGGGLYTALELAEWAGANRHVCLTGGEPLDRDLWMLSGQLGHEKLPAGVAHRQVHIETSGTRPAMWLARHLPRDVWLTVCPKPGYLPLMVDMADEVKVILGGLGDGPGWPTLDDAVRWADAGKLVYVQPRNYTKEIDAVALERVLQAVLDYPQLRVSMQAHKAWRTR